MGETSESTPVVIIRGSGLTIVDRAVETKDLAITGDECVFIRGLSNQETTVYI
jgi:F420-0:gamma-glutamyl ligase